MSAPPAPVTNWLIAALPRKQGRAFLSQCETVQLAFSSVLAKPDHAYHHAYFPLTAFISLVGNVGHHPPMELGLIGNEGMLGASLMLGIREAPLLAVVQGAGSALQISISALQRVLPECPAMLRALNCYLYVTLTQLAQTAVCNRFHEIEARLARWLLLTHDRAHGARFHLTHQFLADMLGVQRSAVTIAAGRLQRRRLIHYSRGEIDILDRAGLEAASCECYAAVVEDYRQRFE